MIYYEGKYQGVMTPGVHFVELKKIFLIMIMFQKLYLKNLIMMNLPLDLMMI